MREALKRSATSVGTHVFMAQVSGVLPLAPNLWPAAKTTFAAAGKASIAARSSRSQAIVSTPHCSSRSRTAASLKRATPMTRRPGIAFFARRASVGPILPATPRIIRSPSTFAMSARSAGLGTARNDSSASTEAKRFGSAGRSVRESVMARWRPSDAKT